jgi:DNA-binding transcriptional regulator LsrR (DeoR family)
MAVSREEHRLLYRIAQAYYKDELTQQQIAQRFGLSRPKVSRLLQKARDEKIVTFTLVPPGGGMAELEHALEQKYGLEEVVIVTISDAANMGVIIQELGPAAAEAVVRSISGPEVVGLTWGRSIRAMVDALPAHSWPQLTVVQMSGGLEPVGAREHSVELARRMAQKFHAKLRLLPAPGIVSSAAAAAALKADHQISETLSIAANADIAIVGLGVPTPDSVLLQDGNLITEEDLQTLQEAHAVGDIGLRYVNAEGHPLDLELNERLIGLTLEQIQDIPRVIGIAGGEPKQKIVYAALRAGLLNVLVTDHVTGDWLLSQDETVSAP